MKVNYSTIFKSAIMPCGLLLIISVMIFACQPGGGQNSTSNSTGTKWELPPQSFPDFGYMVSDSLYKAKYMDKAVFTLKTDYPTELPPESAMPDFLNIDFKEEPLMYLEAIRDYAFEGNLPEWNPHDNRTRGWYHIPWLHVGGGAKDFPPFGGTEGFRGLIKEAPVSPYQLYPEQKNGYQVYAITLINEFAGYTMNNMWKDPNMPDPRATDKRYGGGFPHGAVFAKLLFTDAPEGTDRVPYLTENPLEWDVYITKEWNDKKNGAREIKTVRLLQMDVMARDPRADADVGWVLGTFAYNGIANNENRFMNLIPVGLMWGNDPEDNQTDISTSFPYKETKTNPDLEQTIIFANNPDLPAQHLGWNGRLNGPADLTTSSCMSCHMAAQYPPLTSLVPPKAGTLNGKPKSDFPPSIGGKEWMEWFQNIDCATPMNPEAYSTDFSLQIAISLENFFKVKNQQEQGIYAIEYDGTKAKIGRNGNFD